ncbi:hypothetical protein Y032_0528g2985 [Ancylostoma ceylanicum]|uniref:Uncharacterized protein n=1 Tax=Ancylostoma ceylanicum TaxID=53326 RepID=A0A016WRY5_9BILA|nr:hypothetical protein Y032_0528g2985 [Ancylostoma ceylanicum]
MAKQAYPQELDKLANLHHATKDTVESEITSAIHNIISRTKLAGIVDVSWTHHLMLHTSSEAGGAAPTLQTHEGRNNSKGIAPAVHGEISFATVETAI